MSLKVTVKSAINLPRLKDEEGLIDPYVAVKFRGIKKCTEKLTDELNPQWNKTLEWSLKSPLDPNEQINVKIYDEMFFNRRREIGELNYNIAELLDQRPRNESLRLKPSIPSIKKDEWEKTRLNIEFHYQLKRTVSTKKEPNVPLPYQVTVYVFEGRLLEDSHISPAVTVTCYNKSLTTVTKHETSNPIYNEMKTFYLNMTQSDLFSKEIELTVRDEGSSHRHIIGTFAINIGTVYNEIDHTLFNKWLILGDPHDTMGGAKGFLNVSMSVIGPDDTHIHLSNEGINQDFDIESNLIQPVNVSLYPATLITRLYHAHDIPQVDPSTISEAIRTVFTGKATTQAADPYVVVTFNGLTRQTSVQKKNQNPVWNEQINIGYRFPSVCNKITLQIKDKDNFFSADDFIGTLTINIPEIGVHGQNGFLPSFGPCYINIYGSPQQGFSIFPDKFDAMNKGQLEGVAYRGRLLMEVDTQLGFSIKQQSQGISDEAMQSITKYIGPSKEYTLCVIFNSASMIPKNLKDVQFEVSIGNYHQRIDTHGLTSESVMYHSVNWSNKKPMIEIDSKWEDCSYRISSVNVLLNHLKDLEACLAVADYTADNEEELKEKCSHISEQLQDVMKSCHHALLKMADHAQQHSYTKLDKNLRNHRLDELSNMIILLKTTHQSQEKFAILFERFKKLTIDPQLSIPDVIVWLMSNGNRVGYCRIPAYSVMYSAVSIMSGQYCGKLQTLQLKTPRSSNVKPCEADSSCFIEMTLALGFKEHKDIFIKNTLHQVYGSSFVRDPRKLTLTLNSMSNKYELRAYLHQARDLIGGDNSGLSDPYCVVSCCGVTANTRTVQATITPKWCQTVSLKDIVKFVRPEVLSAYEDKEGSPLLVAVQIFDKDEIGQDDYLGTVTVKPTVRVTNSSPHATLQWYPVTHLGEPAGEILAAFELIKVEGEDCVSEELEGDTIPVRLLPKTAPKVVKVQCLGLREMHNYQFTSVSNPFVRVQCEEETRSTGPLKKDRPLFPDRNITMTMPLPSNELFAPPLNIYVHDKRLFGYSPMVGSHSLSSLKLMEGRNIDGKQLFRITDPVIVSNMRIKGPFKRKSKFDWWSKYYASIGDNSRVQDGYLSADPTHRLTVYPQELEVMFDDFTDIVGTYPLFSGKGKHDAKTATPVGYFKGIISVNDIGAEPNVTGLQPTISDGIPNIYPQKLLVRVYVIKGINLKPCDIFNGESDPYIEITCGSHSVSNAHEYIPNNSNPLFGKLFEIEAELPNDYKLTVTVKDHDHLSRNDIIGSTVIDLENRFLSSHRALIGIPRSFSTSALNSWRDYLSPVDILSTVCSMRGYEISWSGDYRAVQVNGRHYHLDDFEQERLHDDNNAHRLATHVLQQQHLVPEHIETRTLYRDDKHTIPQGQLHMWVDIIPRTDSLTTIPPKVDISPRRPKRYELRVVVWKVTDMVVPDNELTGDFYVTSILNSGATQKTDTHYFAFGGEGNFNWRFVYPFNYDPFARKIIYSEKEHFYSLDSTEQRVEDKISFQVWDKDFFSANDFLGKIEFSLHDAPKLAATSEQCNLETLNNRRIDLFDGDKLNSTAKGWLPVYKVNDRDEKHCTGKLNVWIQMMTEEEAKHRPAGAGRDNPNQYPELKKPERPLLKFNYFDSILKTFKFSIWRNHKYLVILVIVCLTIIIPFLLIF